MASALNVFDIFYYLIAELLESLLEFDLFAVYQHLSHLVGFTLILEKALFDFVFCPLYFSLPHVVFDFIVLQRSVLNEKLVLVKLVRWISEDYLLCHKLPVFLRVLSELSVKLCFRKFGVVPVKHVVLLIIVN